MSSIILTKTYPNVNFFITTVEVDTPVKSCFCHRMVFLRKKKFITAPAEDGAKKGFQ
jgi:hypothetical protein